LPFWSTALTETLYNVPVVSPVSLTLSVRLGAGLDVEAATVMAEDVGHGDPEVA